MALRPRAANAAAAIPSAEAEAPGAVYQVTSQAVGPKAQRVAILLGTYHEHGENHGRVTYQKQEPIPGHPDLKVFIYFWDTRDGLELSGWWFGDSVGGTLVWARAPLLAQNVPPAGWKVPWDAPMPEPGMLSVTRVAAEQGGVAAVAAASRATAPKARPLTASARAGAAPPNVVGSLLAAAMTQAAAGKTPQPAGQKQGTVFMAGLPPDAEEDELIEIFSNVGAVETVKIYRNPSSNLPLGHGFCDFYEASHAALAIQQLQGCEYRGRRLTVHSSRPGPHLLQQTTFVRPPTAPVLQPPPLVGARQPGQAAASMAAVPQDFLDQLVDQMKETSGTSSKVCKYDRDCKSLNCTDTHPNGREIEDVPMTIICRFQRSCKRQGCFYVHPNGREIDESPSLGVCRQGKDCIMPDCIFAHPDCRAPVLMKCDRCQQLGHTKSTCPQIKEGGELVGTSKVRVGGFPPEWSADGCEALVSRIFEELVPFGNLVAPPELSEDELTAVVEFDKPASAWKAAQILTAKKSSLTAEKIYEKKEDTSKCSIFIGNLDYDAPEEELKERLDNVGMVKNLRLVKDRDTNKSKGYAFCDFHDSFTADAAIQVLNGSEFRGRALRVTLAGRALGDKQPPRANGEAAEVQATCQAVITSLPEDWLAMSCEDLVAQLRGDLEIFGKMVKDPEIEIGGSRQVVVEYETPDVAAQTVQAMNNEGLFQMKLKHAAAGGQKTRQWTHEDKNRASLFVGNIGWETTEAQLREQLEQSAGELQSLEWVRVARDKETKAGRGFGFLEFKDEASAMAALELLRGAEAEITEVFGRKLRLRHAGQGAGDAEQGVYTRERSRSRDRRGGSGVVWVTLFVDELSMPGRPQLEPFHSDREVWVDPLLDEGGGHQWLAEFGEVEEVFRIPDIDNPGEESDRGYVRFATHESALGCVRSGRAAWSESERILSSQSSYGSSQSGGAKAKERHSAYPDSIAAEIIGPRGEHINGIQRAIGAEMLAVRGEGLGDSRKPGNSLRNQGRFHFVCKGDADCASKLQPALEKALQQIHERVSERMKSGYYERGKGGQAKAERPSLPSAAPHRQGGPPPPGPPPGAWGPPPGAWGPPPPDGWGAPPPGWGAPPPGWPPPPDGWGAPPPGWPPPADGWGAPPPGWVPPPRPMRDYAPDAIAMLRHHGVLDGSFDEDMVADLLDETFGWQSLLDPVQVRPYMDRFLHAASELKVAICGGRAAPSQSRALPAAAPTNAQRPAPAPSSSRPSSSRPSSSRLPQAVEAPAASPEASRAPQLPSPPPPPPLGSGRGGRALPLSSKARGAPPSASLRVAEPVFSERRGAKRPAEKPPLPPGPPPGRGKIFVPSRQNEGEEEDAIEEDSVFVPSDAHYRGGDEEAEDETVEEAGNVFVPSRFQEGDFAQDDVADSVPTYLREYDAGFTTVGDDEL